MYVSEHMDVVFSLRPPDVKSVLPEVKASLSALSLAGVLRIDAEVTPDYPFLGKATVHNTY